MCYSGKRYSAGLDYPNALWEIVTSDGLQVVCGLCAAVQVRLRLSLAYHPQTDGQPEVFNRTLLELLRRAVNQCHSNWEGVIPAFLYAYHSTVYTADGYTPHHLLFGWTPRDIRAPLPVLPSSDDPDLDAWLESRKEQLQSAQLSLHDAGNVMLAARKASAPAYSCVMLLETYSKYLLMLYLYARLPPRHLSCRISGSDPVLWWRKLIKELCV
jgi:hypothetical protein